MLAQFYVHCVRVHVRVCFWGVTGLTMKCERCQTAPKKFQIQNPQSRADWKCETEDLMGKHAAAHCTLRLFYSACVRVGGFRSTHPQVCVLCQLSICSGSLDDVFIMWTKSPPVRSEHKWAQVECAQLVKYQPMEISHFTLLSSFKL